ncbi:RNA pseudouridine synthase [Carboxylicivirga sediminis]|uniref:RNA pseudouridine synthase n=1 Tax=Carboxylicivirga sediminis TaxID=2006564 RepID=A0A941EZH2_9BACT|nr:RluA family pseudouridine synthase [Carboxylicivirga sediminis]MBR8534378.1 RNA pseudouridine synthase [Carboxylicivirga sediminis]
MDHFIRLKDTTGVHMPQAFTNPFDYSVHPLCLSAKEHLEHYLPNPQKMAKGKMYGILLVKNTAGQIGYLAAYSGNEQNNASEKHFVPQVFDITHPDGFFRKEEEQLNILNRQIEQLLNSPELRALNDRLIDCQRNSDKQLTNAKQALKQAKTERAKKRALTNNSETLSGLIRESQRQKSNYNKLKKKLREEEQQIAIAIKAFDDEAERLKKMRKQQSALVQKQLFDSYVFLNATGEQKSATAIFQTTPVKVPPAGAGDCAAPKLLQYAFMNHLHPICMAEFWWGPSPLNAVRKHNYFYPACKSKCEPILGFMLQGLNIEKTNNHQAAAITILYEDPHLAIISKPAGLLSVPGKEMDESVLIQAKALFKDTTGPLIVHRLDMATSGLMLIAKTKEVHEHLQKQFLSHSIKKSYVAILNGVLKTDEGEINLPLRVDLNDRPRQMVCYNHGKQALTQWKVIQRQEGFTKVLFKPITGRTHQLRVHAAHHLGLNTAIVGDPLYGQKATRLMLHARDIEFYHPTLKKQFSYTLPEETQADWNEI